MIYDKIKKGIFIERPNRFIALVEIEGIIEVCHVKNTGRCKELLTDEGAEVLAIDCSITEDMITPGLLVEVRLTPVSTKRIPAEVFALEKQHLMPVPSKLNILTTKIIANSIA